MTQIGPHVHAMNVCILVFGGIAVVEMMLLYHAHMNVLQTLQSQSTKSTSSIGYTVTQPNVV